jgi:arylsulfatase
MLRTDRYKMVVHHGQEIGELYDLATDPGESRNLWTDPDLTGMKLELFKRLCDRMAWAASDPLPERFSDY